MRHQHPSGQQIPTGAAAGDCREQPLPGSRGPGLGRCQQLGLRQSPRRPARSHGAKPVAAVAPGGGEPGAGLQSRRRSPAGRLGQRNPGALGCGADRPGHWLREWRWRPRELAAPASVPGAAGDRCRWAQPAVPDGWRWIGLAAAAPGAHLAHPPPRRIRPPLSPVDGPPSPGSSPAGCPGQWGQRAAQGCPQHRGRRRWPPMATAQGQPPRRQSRAR